MAIRTFKPDDLQTLYQSLRTYHNIKRGHQEHEDSLYDQDTSWARATVPDDIPIFQSSLATDVVDQIGDQLRTDEPMVNVRATGNSEEARKLVTLLTRWALRDIRNSQERGEVDPYSQAGRDLPLRGEAVVKRMHNSDLSLKPVRTDFDSDEKHEEAVSKWEDEMRNSWPLLPARPIDPLNIFLPPNATWPFPYIVEIQKRRQIDICEMYSEWKGAVANKKVPSLQRKLNAKEIANPLREVELIHFWSESHHIVEADGVEIVSMKNPYGFVPYCHAYSGLGRNDTNSGSEQKAVGILRKMIGELEADVMLRTITFSLAQYYVFPRVLVPEGRAEKVAKQMRVRGILEYENRPDEIRWLESPPVPPQVSEFLGQGHHAIARRVNPVQRGLPITPATSGVHEAIELVQSDTALGDIRNALNQIVTQSVITAARIMKALDLSANVIGGADSEERLQDRIIDAEKKHFDHPAFEVEFKAIDPVEDTRQQQAGLRLYEGRAISKRTYHEKFLTRIVDDPEEEGIQDMLEKAEEAWISSEEFRAWAVRQYMGDQQTQELLGAEGQPAPPPGAGGMGLPATPAAGGPMAQPPMPQPPMPQPTAPGLPMGETDMLDRSVAAMGGNPLAIAEGVERRRTLGQQRRP